jgi:hypothetical protein
MLNAPLLAFALVVADGATTPAAPADAAAPPASSTPTAPPAAEGATPSTVAPPTQDAPAETAAPKSEGPCVLSPTSMDKRRPLITDRPDLTESPYTVDAGHLQVESDVVVATWRQGKVDSIDLMPSNVKIGLTSSTDLQLLVPALGVGFDGDGNASPAAGDLGVRLKWNLFGNDGGDLAVGVMPWFFVGGADLRPGAGVIIPVAIALPAETSLGTMVVANYVPVDGGSYDVEGDVSVTVSHAVAGDVAGYLEAFASGRPMTRDGELLASAGLTYVVGDSIQFDAGFRLPVLTADPRVETFVGVSARH